MTKYVNLLTKTKDAELGYAIDSQYYGIPGYNRYVKDGLARLTAADVNKAIRTHLSMDNLRIVVIGKDCESLRKKIIANEPSPMTYNSPKPKEVTDEDEAVSRFKIDVAPDAVKIVPVDTVFE